MIKINDDMIDSIYEYDLITVYRYKYIQHKLYILKNIDYDSHIIEINGSKLYKDIILNKIKMLIKFLEEHFEEHDCYENWLYRDINDSKYSNMYDYVNDLISKYIIYTTKEIKHIFKLLKDEIYVDKKFLDKLELLLGDFYNIYDIEAVNIYINKQYYKLHSEKYLDEMLLNIPNKYFTKIVKPFYNHIVTNYNNDENNDKDIYNELILSRFN